MRVRASLLFLLLAPLGCVGSQEPEEHPDQPDPLAIVRGDAAQPTPDPHPDVLRMLVWNIKSGRDSSIEAVASRLSALEADVLVLQEVDSGTRRSGAVDQPGVLGRRLGLYYAFAPTIPWDGGIFGILTLSRQPFASVERVTLTNDHAEERRTGLDTSWQLSDARLRVVNHHADVVLPAAVQSTRELVEHLAPSIGSGVALAGDFNQLDSDEGPGACVEAGLVDLGAQHGSLPTAGARRIDYVFVDGVLERCVTRMAIERTSESDHHALVVDIDEPCLRQSAE